MIEACDRPIMFELTQTADLSRWQGETGDPIWRGFVGDVRRFVGAPDAIAPSAAPAPAMQKTRPSLAVLPFVNRSGLGEDDLFVETLAEDLSAALSANRWIRVVAASATAMYRAGARDLRQIGRDLGARYLLEGSLRRAGEMARVTAQVVAAESGDILWSQRFDRPVADLASLQEELAEEIAAHTRMQVEHAETEHAFQNAGDVSAWDALVRNYARATHGTQAARAAAVADAKRAVERDPNDASAWSSLASWQAHLLHFGGREDPELAQEIAHNVARARVLDPNNAEVLGGAATALAWLRRPLEALPMAERSISINPNESARLVLGSILARLGRSDAAIAEFDVIERLNPNSLFAHLSLKWRSMAHLQAGRLEPALEAAERSLHLVPNSESLIQIALCLAKAGQDERAREILRRLPEAEPGFSRGMLEHILRDLYCGSSAVDDYAAVVGKLWDEAVTGDALA
jgi:TolB-like protein